MTIGHGIIFFLLIGISGLLLKRRLGSNSSDINPDNWTKTLTLVIGSLGCVWLAVFVIGGMDEKAASAGIGILALFGGLLLYLVPTIIALNRDHDSKNAVLAINIFLGWIVIGWIVSLVWAIVGKKRTPDPESA